MDQSGHKSIGTMRGYVRDAELFKDNGGSRIALSVGDWGREHQVRCMSRRRVHVNPGVAGVGEGPILRSGENDKAPPCTAQLIDQTLTPHS